MHYDTLSGRQRWLLRTLCVFLVVTLLILGAAVAGFLYVDRATTSVWTPWLLRIAAVLLVGGPIWVVFTAARLPRAPAGLILLLALASPALAGSVHCTTYEEKTLGRLQTRCDEGTRAVSTWSPTLQRWETTITSSPRQTCTGQLNPRTQQVEVRGR